MNNPLPALRERVVAQQPGEVYSYLMIFDFHTLDITTRKSIEMTEIARGLRKDGTRSEAILWKYLRNRQFHGLKVRRQHPIGPFIVDFYIHKRRIAIEIDGSIHDLQQEYDQYRQRMIESVGVQFFRVTSGAVEKSVEEVLDGLWHCLERNRPHPQPLSHRAGRGVPEKPSPGSAGEE